MWFLWLVLCGWLGWAQEPQVVMPQVQYAAPALFPEEERAAGQEAVVELEVSIDEQGRVTDVVVVDAPSEAFAQAARLALKAYRFTPATYDGEAIGVTVAFTLPFALDDAPRPSVEGRVREAGVRTPLSGVALELTAEGASPVYAVTDDEGRFVAYDLAPGTWTVQVQGGGLRPDPVEVQVTDDAAVQLTLFAIRDRPWQEEGIEEITVVSEAVPAEVTERRLNARKAMSLPGTNGDLLRAVLNFPGLARPPLGIASFIIRGTQPDDTKFYVDGVRFPQVFHFGGLATVLSGDALEEIRFLSGNFGPRYGDGLGGVIDLLTEYGVPERSNGYVSVDVYQAAAFVEQKIGERWAITASGRRSYADAVLGPVLSAFGGGAQFQAPRYYDAQLRVVHEAPGGGVFDSLLSFSDDQFRLLNTRGDNVQFGLSTTFFNASVGWRAPLGGGWRTETRLNAGPERRAFTFDGQESFEEAVVLGLRQELSRPVPDEGRVGWRVGLDARAEAFRFGLGGGRITRDEGEGWRVRPAVYAESTLRAGPVDVLPGLRASFLSVPEVHTSWTVDPRLAMRARLGLNTTLIGTVGRYSQYPQSRELLPSSRGVPTLRPSWSLQTSVGVRQQLPGDLSLDVTGFYNELYDLVVGHSDRFEFTSGPPLPLPIDDGAYANEGRGRVFGGELLLSYEGRRASAIVSATVSRATRTNREGEEERLFPFDQTVVVSALGTYQLPRAWTVGGRVRAGSGNPYIPVVNRALSVADRTFIPVYGDTFSRLRTYWTLDLRVDKTWTFDKWKLTLYLDIQNITDPGNIELIGYTYDFRAEDPIGTTPPLPAFGLKGAW